MREKIRSDIIKWWVNLEWTTNSLLSTFEAGQERNAEIINNFFNQPYFSWKESLIDKLAENNPNITFEDIKDEWINLALLYNNRMWDFKECLHKIRSSGVKHALKIKLSEKIKAKTWVWAPYDDFDAECLPVPVGTDFTAYFQKIVQYLTEKEKETNSKKVNEILEDIFITNDDLNSILPLSQRINLWTRLKDPSIPENTIKAFDKLLSFEIWKEANRTISIAKDIEKKFGWLLTNSFPAINTIIWESDEFKYDENKLWPEYEEKLQEIKNNTTFSEFEKNKKTTDLKREYYIKYLKSQNRKIWDTLEQLYKNNFDYSKVEPNTLKGYIDKVASIRIKMLIDNGINDYLKINFWNLDSFEHFYKNLADPTTGNIILSNVAQPWPWTPPLTRNISIPIQKNIVKWENLRLKDINQFWKDSKNSFDALPIEFTINKSDIINNNDITIEDKTKLLNLLAKFYQWNWDKYVIKWENVWILIYLYFIINNRDPITEMDPEKQKEIENTFWHASNHKIDWSEDGNPKEYLIPEVFKNKIEEMWPGKFENWSEIRLPIGNSELPWWWYKWMKIKLDNIDMKRWTFTCRTFGWELKFSDRFEWKAQKFDMNEDFFEKLKKLSKDGEKIWLLPNPERTNFNTFKNTLNKKWTFDLSFPPEWINRDWNKITQKVIDKDWKEKEIEVKYFWADWDDKSTYRIEYNPNKHSFTVSSIFNWEKKWKNWKTEKKRFSYKRDMDWNNFLIFFNQKWLHPQTEEESNEAIQKQDQEFKVVNGKKRTLNRFSFNNIKNWFKDIFTNLKNKIDEYDKERTEKFKKITERPLLRTLSSFPLLPKSIKNAIWKRQQELYNESNNEAWSKIEAYLKELQKDEQFADTFNEAPDELKLLWWNKSYKKFLEDLRKKSENNELEDDEIHRAAALLLANIEKWGSPFRWLTEYENKWFRVKILLGKWHYEQFLEDKENCIKYLKKAWKEKDQFQDLLAKCEMEYIINNITWANWKVPFFKSREERWINWKKKYIPNPSQNILSTQFADKLKDCRDKRFTQSSVEEEFSKISHNSFDQAKEDFYGKLKSSRYTSAIGNLRKMIALTKNEAQRSEIQKCFIIYMLSWVLDVYGRKDLRDQAEKWWKTLWFLPWMLAKNTNNSEDVATLLNDFDPTFATKVKSYLHKWDLKNWSMNIEKLISEVNSRWGDDTKKMEKFEAYTKEFRNKQFPLNSTLYKLQKSVWESGMENINESILKNPYIANSWWLLSNANVVRDRMRIRDGDFEWDDNDEKNNRKAFWDKITKEVENTPINTLNINTNLNNAKLLLKQYCDWFQIYNKQETYRRIKTAYYRKNYIGNISQYNDNGNRQNMGIIDSKEIYSIIRYAFQWNVMSECFWWRRLPEEMKKALKAFQQKFKDAFDKWILSHPKIISEVFGIDNDSHIQVYWLWSWSEYNRTVTWRKLTVNDDDKNEKNRIRNIFTSWKFINDKIADMEKRLKNLASGDYEPVTTSTLESLENNIRPAPTGS